MIFKKIAAAFFVVFITLNAYAQCPTNGNTDIDVCNDASGSSTITATFNDGTPPFSYILFDLSGPTAVSDPFGPVTVTSIAPNIVEFGDVPDGDYLIRVNGPSSCNSTVGGLGITVNSANFLDISVASITPACNPGDGEIDLDVSGGTAPYSFTWTQDEDGGFSASTEDLSGLNSGTYNVTVVDDANCSEIITGIVVAVISVPEAGPAQTVCAESTSLSADPVSAAELGTWSDPFGAGVLFTDVTDPNTTVSNLPIGATTLRWQVTDITATCPPVTDDVIITRNEEPTADAGLDQTICSDGGAVLAGVIGGSATTGTWSGGAGTFTPDATTLNATYTPDASESGTTVTLTLTTDDPDGAGPCVAAVSTVDIIIGVAPTADAGLDQTICSDGGAVLAGVIGGSATTGTWSGGAGTFTPNATDLNATYTPDASEAGTTVTLTLTTNDPDGAGPCVVAVSTVDITINEAATADAGVDQTVCDLSGVVLAGSIGGSATTGTWSGGAGTFTPDATTLNATYTPDASESGTTVTLTLTTDDPDGAGPCVAAVSTVDIIIGVAPTADAGLDQTICSDGGAVLAGVIGGSATTGTWSGGAGTFTPNATDLNATYTPDASEAGTTVTLTLTTDDPDGAGPCVVAVSTVDITINEAATADAGVDQTVCDLSGVVLAGSIGGSATTGTWSGGAGTFTPDATTLNATYTPDASESGTTVTLTLTTDDPDGAGPCVAAVSTVDIIIGVAPTADAGLDQTICSDGGAVLAGVIGGSATTGTWSGGAGTFTPNATDLNATYTPDASEAGTTVTLTLTTNDPDGAGPCVVAVSTVDITINEAATADAGVDQTVCDLSGVVLAGSIGGSATTGTWSGGAGTFTPDATTLNATYTPDASESGTTVTLTLTTDDPDGAGPCVAAVSTVDIIIGVAPTADAGLDQTICSDGGAVLAGVIGGSATTGTWSGGAGTFTPNATDLNATYTPDASEAGTTVTLTLTTDDPDGAGPCVVAVSTVDITINEAATADAGVDQTVCDLSGVVLAGSIGGSATTGTWSGGAGTFTPDATTLNATYTPDASESGTTVTLTLTTDDPDGAGPCVAAVSTVDIIIGVAPTADAGLDQTICSDGGAVLAGVIGGSATTGTWSGGAGTFTPNATDLNATYTPDASEAGTTVTLTLTTDDPDGAGPCVVAVSTVDITINEAATADAGVDQTVCDLSGVVLAGSIGGSATTGTWSGGAGTFTPDATTLNATYTPDASESGTTVTLTLTTDDPDGAGPCVAAVSTVDIIIGVAPTADAGLDQTICSDGGAVLAGVIGGSATTGTWSGGAGTFTPNATDLNATYTPDASEAGTTVTLTLTTNDPDGAGPCVVAVSTVDITINEAATADAGVDQTVCDLSGVVLAGSIGGSATTGTWSGGAGTFTPDATTLNATYTPDASESGTTVTLTLTTDDPDGAGPCVAAVSTVDIIIGVAPTADAGLDQTICSDGGAVLAGVIGGSATTGTWSGGAGTFTPNATDLNATYTPDASEAGTTVTLTLTTDDPDGAGPCVVAVSTVDITINEAATADAGVDQTVCDLSGVVLAGSIGGSATTGTWSGGAGTFTPDATTLNATYTPDASESGTTVTLTLTTDDPDGAGPCVAAVSTVDIIIGVAPTADAGLDQTICSDGGAVLAGVIGGSATTGTWSGGAGTFTPNATDLNATYTPDASEAGTTVTLTLTTNDPDGAGPCVVAVSTVDITINEAATADAGVDQTVCDLSGVVLAGSIGGSATTGTWSGGAGTFTPDATTLNATYTPDASESGTTVTLTLTTDDPDGAGPCVAAVSTVDIIIGVAPTADAGLDQTICSDGGAVLAGVIGGSATTGTWSGGAGTFTPNATDLNATYTPDASEAGTTVTLTLTTNDPDGAGPCVVAVSTVDITINEAATADAGVDQTVCDLSGVVLAGSIGGSATTGTWSGGAGTFTPDATTLNATYTPDASESGTTVTLTLTTDDPDGAGPCVAAVSTVDIIIGVAPTADAGLDQTICSDGGAVLAGVIGGSATTGTWSGGAGTFTPNATDLNATYTPDASEAGTTVTLTLTTNDPDGAGPCVVAVSTVDITINEAATADAGVDQTVCDLSGVVLAGSIGGSATTGTWSGGAGTFTPDATTLNATYTPDASESGTTVTLTLTTDDPDGAGPCVAAVSTVDIIIGVAPTADAGLDQTICSDGGAVLAGVIGGSATTGTWSGGAGTFTPNATDLNATYTPDASEAGTTVTLTLTTDDPDGAGPCVVAVSTVDITINSIPAPTITGPSVVCFGDTQNYITEFGAGENNYQWTVVGGTGTGANSAFFSVTWDSPTGPYEVSVNYANSDGCFATNPTVLPITVLDPNLILSQSPNPGLCVGSSIDIIASAGFDTYEFRDGVGGPVLQAASASEIFSSTALTDGQIIEVEAFSAVCGIVNETITVAIGSAPSLLLTQNPDPSCAGTSVEISATAGFDTYEFRDGVGGPVLQAASSDDSFDATILTDGQVIEVEAFSAVCGNFTEVITLNITTVNPLVLTQNPDPGCAGTSVEISATAGFDTYEFRDGLGGPVLQAASVDNTFDATTLTDGQVIEVEAFSAVCGVSLETITVNIVTVPTLALTQSPDPSLCAGLVIELTATAGFDTYEFRDGVGGPVLQAASVDNTFDATSFTDGQEIEVEATSATCGIFNTTINVNVGASQLTLSQSPNPGLCVGSSIDIIASAGFDTYEFRDGVGGPVLQAASASEIFSSTALTDGQIIEVEAFSAVCGIVNETITVAIGSAPSLLLTQNPDPSCAGTSVEISATAGFDTYEFRDGVGGPVLQAASSDDSFDATTLTDGQVIEVEAFSAVCGNFTEVITLNITTVNPLVLTQNPDPGCAGTSVEISATAGFDTYEFRDGLGGPVLQAASVDNTFDATTLTDGQVIEVEAFSAVCGVSLETIAVNIVTVPTLALTQSPDPSLCAGLVIELTATAGFDTYEFRDGVGGPVLQAASVDNTFDATSFTDGQEIEVEATSATCGIFNTTINVNVGTLTLNLVQAPDPVCQGLNLTLTATSGFDTYEFRDGVGGPVLQAASASNTFINSGLSDGQVIEVEAFSAACGILSSTLSVNVLPTSDPLCGGTGGGTDCSAFTTINEVDGGTLLPTCEDPEAGSITYEVEGISGTAGTYSVTLIDIVDSTYSRFGQDNIGTVTVTNLRAGSFFVVVRDELTGDICDGRTTVPQRIVAIETATSVQAELDSVIAITCSGDLGSAIINRSQSTTGAYFYSIDGGLTWVLLEGENRVDGLTPGTTTTVFIGEMENDPCPAEIQVFVNDTSTPIDFDARVEQNLTECDTNDGEIAVDFPPIGGNNVGDDEWEIAFKPSSLMLADTDFGPFTESITFRSLTPDSYNVYVRDITGCVALETLIITAPAQIELTSSLADASCESLTDGRVNLSVDNLGSVPTPLTVVIVDQANLTDTLFEDSNWSGVLTSFPPDGLENGSYQAIVSTQVDGICEGIVSFDIGGPSLVTFENAFIEQSCIVSGFNNTYFNQLVLEGIRGELGNRDFTLTVIDESQDTTNVNFVLQSGDRIILNSQQFPELTDILLVEDRDYRLQLSQVQASCPEPVQFDFSGLIEIPDAVSPVEITIENIDSSLPGRATGSFDIADISGGVAPYVAFLESNISGFPGFGPDTIEFNTTQRRFLFDYNGLDAGSYNLFIVDQLGCEVPLDIDIPSDSTVVIPNVFTPNGDGSNDFFEMINIDDGNTTVVINNRWGKTVFESSNYGRDNFWSGGSTPDGVYFYKVESGGEVYTGWVEIIRGSGP